MMRKNILLLCGASLLFLNSCGSNYSGGGGGNGGGGGGGGSAQPEVVDGVFSGVASNGDTFWAVILPNEELFGIYGTVNGNQILLDGMITGQGALTANGEAYNANVTDLGYTGSAKSGTFSADNFTGASINGTLTEGGTVTTFYAPSIEGSVWDYGTTFQTPASLSAISGTWTGTLLDGMTTTITISSTGSLTGSTSRCSFSGRVTP